LIRRLRNVGEALMDEDVEPNSPDYPGLGGLAAVLVENGFLEHRDKEVRLHTVLACMQLLEVVRVSFTVLSDMYVSVVMYTNFKTCSYRYSMLRKLLTMMQN
jgi:hypothetical protein